MGCFGLESPSNYGTRKFLNVLHDKSLPFMQNVITFTLL